MLWMGYDFASSGKEELATTLFSYTIGTVASIFVAGQVVKAITSKKEVPPSLPSED